MPALIGAMRGMKPEHDARFALALLVGHGLLGEGFAEEREDACDRRPRSARPRAG